MTKPLTNKQKHSPKLTFSSPTPPGPGLYLGEVMAEAEALTTVQTEQAQGHHTGFAPGEPTGVISFDGSRDQSIKVFLSYTILSRVACGKHQELLEGKRPRNQPKLPWLGLGSEAGLSSPPLHSSYKGLTVS